MKTNKDTKNKTEIKLPSLYTIDEFQVNILKIFKENFFSMKFFTYLEKTENRVQKISDIRLKLNPCANYLIFYEIVNASFPNSVMEVLYSFGRILEEEERKKQKKRKGDKKTLKSNTSVNEEEELSIYEEFINKENFQQHYKFSKLLKNFIILFAQAPCEFRLKPLFAEFLDIYGVDHSSRVFVNVLKNHFLYFCHIFFLLGFLSRKRTNDVYMKNYFQVNSYFKN